MVTAAFELWRCKDLRKDLVRKCLRCPPRDCLLFEGLADDGSGIGDPPTYPLAKRPKPSETTQSVSPPKTPQSSSSASERSEMVSSQESQSSISQETDISVTWEKDTLSLLIRAILPSEQPGWFPREIRALLLHQWEDPIQQRFKARGSFETAVYQSLIRMLNSEEIRRKPASTDKGGQSHRYIVAEDAGSDELCRVKRAKVSSKAVSTETTAFQQAKLPSKKRDKGPQMREKNHSAVEPSDSSAASKAPELARGVPKEAKGMHHKALPQLPLKVSDTYRQSSRPGQITPREPARLPLETPSQKKPGNDRHQQVSGANEKLSPSGSEPGEERVMRPSPETQRHIDTTRVANEPSGTPKLPPSEASRTTRTNVRKEPSIDPCAQIRPPQPQTECTTTPRENRTVEQVSEDDARSSQQSVQLVSRPSSQVTVNKGPHMSKPSCESVPSKDVQATSAQTPQKPLGVAEAPRQTSALPTRTEDLLERSVSKKPSPVTLPAKESAAVPPGPASESVSSQQLNGPNSLHNSLPVHRAQPLASDSGTAQILSDGQHGHDNAKPAGNDRTDGEQNPDSRQAAHQGQPSMSQTTRLSAETGLENMASTTSEARLPSFATNWTSVNAKHAKLTSVPGSSERSWEQRQTRHENGRADQNMTGAARRGGCQDAGRKDAGRSDTNHDTVVPHDAPKDHQGCGELKVDGNSGVLELGKMVEVARRIQLERKRIAERLADLEPKRRSAMLEFKTLQAELEVDRSKYHDLCAQLTQLRSQVVEMEGQVAAVLSRANERKHAVGLKRAELQEHAASMKKMEAEFSDTGKELNGLVEALGIF